MFDSNQFFGGERGFYPLNIEQSLRFNDDDSAYLSRTPATAGNRKTWTWSGWVKRGNVGIAQVIFQQRADSDNSQQVRIMFETDNIQIIDQSGGVTQGLYQTTAVYRDPSAWYHIVIAFDTTDATAGDRVKLYVNGDRVTSFSTSTDWPLNYDTSVNNTVRALIGVQRPNTGSTLNAYLDGYLAEVHFCDGTAYDADAFGEFKSGVWVAKSPSVTYGTNGFYLDFANSADIGNDVSGEGNDWTPNNFTASDVVLDSPTNNFATLNPIDKGSTVVISNGNLDTETPSGLGSSRATIGVSSGKWYWEVTATVVSSSATDAIGIGNSDAPVNSYVGISEFGYAYTHATGNKLNNNSQTSYGASWTTGDVIGVALDMDAGTLAFFKNNVSQGVAFSGLTGTFFPMMFVRDLVGLYSFNFGQLGFTYTPPTGYLALSTANLPEPTISPADDASPSDYFNTVLYTGNGSTDHNITGVGFQPDFVWLKERSSTSFHQLLDAVRGAGKRLESNVTDAEVTPSPVGLSSFDTDGFTVENNNGYNESSQTYVAWNWKANGSGVSNTDGTITSTVSANTTSGFSIVSYTGNGTAGSTVGHGLGVAPSMIIVKKRNTATSSPWTVGFSSLGWDKYILLNTTGASATDSNVWNATPTSSVFYLGNDVWNNGSTNTHVAYCFHSVEGFSKFGSYTGNGSADGPFVYTGFRPAFVMIKRTDTSGYGWAIRDDVRDTYNPAEHRIDANVSFAEQFPASDIDFVSNGFKVRDTDLSINASGGTYIYACFAENPFKYSNAR